MINILSNPSICQSCYSTSSMAVFTSRDHKEQLNMSDLEGFMQITNVNTCQILTQSRTNCGNVCKALLWKIIIKWIVTEQTEYNELTFAPGIFLSCHWAIVFVRVMLKCSWNADEIVCTNFFIFASISCLGCTGVSTFDILASIRLFSARGILPNLMAVRTCNKMFLKMA